MAGIGEPTLWSNLNEGIKLLNDSKFIGKIFLYSNGESLNNLNEESCKYLDAFVISEYKFLKNKNYFENFKKRYFEKIIIKQTNFFISSPIKDHKNSTPCFCICPGPILIGDKLFFYCTPMVFNAAKLMGVNVFNYNDMYSKIKENYLNDVKISQDSQRNFELCKYCLSNKIIRESLELIPVVNKMEQE